MGSQRRIASIRKSQPTIEGAGVRLKRAFGFDEVPDFDPFLLLDDFHDSKPEEFLAGFPWHPHRGIETITYLLDGVVEHGDSLGNAGVIGPGDVQWMTAGSGVVHQEMPKGSERGTLWGLQLWANLPAEQKMMPPRYRDVKAATIPEVDLGDGITAKIVCGESGGVTGPVRDIVTRPTYLDVSVPANGVFRRSVAPEDTVIAYVLAGQGYFDDQRDPFAVDMVGSGWADVERSCLCGPESVVLYKREGDTVAVSAADAPLRFLFLTGRPLSEPVAWYGPIVMNTEAELRQAFKEYRDGTFIKKVK